MDYRSAYVTVFARAGQLILLPLGQTEHGLQVPVEPVIVLTDPTLRELVDGLSQSLQTSAVTVIPQPIWKSFRSPLYAAVGLKSERRFYPGTKACCVQTDDQASVAVCPILWEKSGYREDLSKAVHLPATSECKDVAEQVLAVIRTADVHP